MNCWSVPSSHTRELKNQPNCLTQYWHVTVAHCQSCLPSWPRPWGCHCVSSWSSFWASPSRGWGVCVGSLPVAWSRSGFAFLTASALPEGLGHSLRLCVLTLAAQHIYLGKCLVSLPRIAFSCLSSVPGTWYSCKELELLFLGMQSTRAGLHQMGLRALHALRKTPFGCFCSILYRHYSHSYVLYPLIATFLRSMTT